jgi:hypothetical protein
MTKEAEMLAKNLLQVMATPTNEMVDAAAGKDSGGNYYSASMCGKIWRDMVIAAEDDPVFIQKLVAFTRPAPAAGVIERLKELPVSMRATTIYNKGVGEIPAIVLDDESIDAILALFKPAPVAGVIDREAMARAINVHAMTGMPHAYKAADAILALKPTMAGEPVAWRYRRDDTWPWIITPAKPDHDGFEIEPLYASSAPSGRDPATIEACAKVAEDQKKDFLSPGYASEQPLGSFCERFACDEVAKAIRALVTEER